MGGKNYSLQVLRAVAALLVVFDHSYARYITEIEGAAIPALVYLAGAVGVKVFFVISGYIIYHSAKSGVGQPSKLGQFLCRRIIRVAPLYWLVTIIYGLRLALGGDGPDLGEWVRSLMFIPYAQGSDMRPIVGLGWTLNFEMFFYLAFSLVFFVPRYVGVAIVALGMAVFAAAGGALAPQFPSLSLLAMPILMFFAAGLGLALLEELGLPVYPRVGPVVAVIFATVLLVLPLCLLAAGLTGLRVAEELESGACILAVAICICARGSISASRLFGMGVALGDASYSLYLTHVLILTSYAATMAWVNARWGISAFVYVTFFMLAAGVLARLVYVCIESPMLKYLGKGCRS